MSRLISRCSLVVLLSAVAMPGWAQSFASVELIGQDYALRARETLRPGLTAFSFKTEGNPQHFTLGMFSVLEVK